MNMKDQAKKAERFLELHHSKKLLVLPNIWDVLGARLLEKSGFQAVATASASVAYSNGYRDGEYISFDRLLNILAPICRSTLLPVSADIERGYAESNTALLTNIKSLIRYGVVGINIEDSVEEGKQLVSVERQCERIELIRKAARREGVPLVINARTDIFLSKDFKGDKVAEAVRRAQNYKNAGADCFYPILCDANELMEINAQIDLPVNVLATKDTPPMTELENSGISRLSLGPGLLKAALTKMREVVAELKSYGGYGSFTHPGIISSQEIVDMISG